ncbi:SusC/RagA family TonB-linked outer membrane protein [Chitinophaga sp. MM2321]|uniref:SusC/RagA family TonB-linked outer membrane protein n=1 Tax=Chitinophaga sp. MM2321 TaxID=3137178 RepID=UPI0032D5ADA8
MQRSRCILLFLIASLSWLMTNAQEKPITGVVVSSDGNIPLIGASVILKGTNTGAVTDVNGKFTIKANIGQTLVVRYVGFPLKEVTIQNTAALTVQLDAQGTSLGGVVVTALGMKRTKRSLGYSVGEIKSEDISKVPQENVLNSLTAKVPGMKIINTTGEINSDPMVVIRGFKSLSGNDAPLIVVDGLPTGNDAGVLSDLSADNIESVSVLKGPSAAALYGSRAGSGVLLITTKNGKGQKGLGVSVNSAYVASVPYKYVPLQQEFVTGSNGGFNETTNLWWGPRMGTSVARFGTNGEATPLTPHPDNVKNFVNVGNSYINDVSIRGSNDKGSFNLSLSDSRSSGVYPASELRKDAVSLSATYNITSKLRVAANFNYLNSGSDNFRAQSDNYHPYEDIYFTPNWADINELKDYWKEKDVKQNVWGSDFNNPWFNVYENVSGFRKVRPYGSVKLDWDITKDLSLMTRIGTFNESYTTESRTAKSEHNRPNGSYVNIASQSQEVNTDILLNYKKEIGDFSFNIAGGGNLFFSSESNTNVNGLKLILPGLYTAGNIDKSAVIYSSGKYKKRINGLMGTASVGYKELVYLDLTGRNDWSSTLPKDNRSYFYPSASLSIIASQLLHLPETISLLKLRGGWAKVGKDTDPYQLAMALDQSLWGDNTQFALPGTRPSSDLIPESIISSEVGLDFSLFKNRLGLNFTYYEMEDKNQITNVSVAPESGYLTANINAGIVKNKGVEISLNAVPIQTKSFRWDVNFNFTKEKSRITQLPSGVSNYQFWNRANIYNQTAVGGVVGDVWGNDVVRVKEGPYAGWPLLDDNGYVKLDPELKKIGNVMNDFSLGFQTNVTYKRFTVSASVDWRQGGEYYSESMKRLARDGRADSWFKEEGNGTFTGILSNKSFNGDNEKLAAEIKSNPGKYNAANGLTWVGGRDADYGGFEYGGSIPNGAFFPGVRPDGNGGYVENFGSPGTKYFRSDLIADPGSGYWSRGVQTWMYDASFIKLRELAVAYSFSDQVAKTISAKGVTLSAFMRNLILWTKAQNYIDPETAINNTNERQTSSKHYALGYDRAFMYPWTLTLGLKLNVQF